MGRRSRRRPPLLLAITSITSVLANVEKVIFTGPPTVNIPPVKPSLADLGLDFLSPHHTAIRTNLSRIFPADEGLASRGQSTWLLLHHLVEGRQYELRVCWAAVEPTSFTLDVHQLDHAWDTPDLIQSLFDYASSRREVDVPADAGDNTSPQSQESVLLLHVRAAADYFTDDVQLMRHAPPVLVDLILDPFLYNLVPLSLVPTAGFLVLVAVVTWFVAQWVSSGLGSVAQHPEKHAKKQN
ncbi:hypothetical protein L249_2213 [Ophiocordyceps polyrhachis-furcata BCC 54312]|uniref:Protein PBN1 n=1 Tax=Ophiocordyceps polyrhachis-furcata BCC 54312 TaxID=1330021 RepID=A0A367LQI2_9HYPO|nr:hypothetical protein L249_2213 [Ophiocordyceps polyrhachis-furcata BCC 54312]